MKKISLFILLTLVVITVFAQENVKYFRRFYIDARQGQYRTEVPILEDFARKTSSYKVLYDENGRIKDVRFVIHGTQSFDESGFTGVIITYTDSTERRAFVNNSNKPIKNQGVYSYVLVFGKKEIP